MARYPRSLRCWRLKKGVKRAGQHLEPAAQYLSVSRFCFEAGNDRAPVRHAASNLVRTRFRTKWCELLIPLDDEGFLCAELSAHEGEETVKFELHDCALLLSRFY